MPYDSRQMQSLQLTADMAGQSNSIASQSLRVMAEAARQVHVVSPKLVPDQLPGGPSLAESLGGKIVSTSA